MKVEGHLVFNSLSSVLEATLAGFGLAYLPREQVKDQPRAGKLVEVLTNWCQTFEGYHLYYPSRRHPPPAFALLVERLRARSP